jgi:hypothetical protein
MAYVSGHSKGKYHGFMTTRADAYSRRHQHFAQTPINVYYAHHSGIAIMHDHGP